MQINRLKKILKDMYSEKKDISLQISKSMESLEICFTTERIVDKIFFIKIREFNTHFNRFLIEAPVLCYLTEQELRELSEYILNKIDKVKFIRLLCLDIKTIVVKKLDEIMSRYGFIPIRMLEDNYKNAGYGDRNYVCDIQLLCEIVSEDIIDEFYNKLVNYYNETNGDYSFVVLWGDYAKPICILKKNGDIVKPHRI